MSVVTFYSLDIIGLTYCRVKVANADYPCKTTGSVLPLHLVPTILIPGRQGSAFFGVTVVVSTVVVRQLSFPAVHGITVLEHLIEASDLRPLPSGSVLRFLRLL